ncbi:sensor histidine kinase [Neobacillus sp. LXY-4]|uniref:sensor histidine kinase n=1 Tax=Neobacillus sp. LXY-4 TaxID=3379826 RepID=UPI003EE1A60F
MKFPAYFFEEITKSSPDGIVIMDKERTILYTNEAAETLTGWTVGEKVPYCTYCQQRVIENGTERCILTAEDPLPYFHSHLAIYSGIEQAFEMRLLRQKYMEKEYFILRLRLTVENENSEKAKFHELLVQETMLAQEFERRKIARELHDHIGQSVYSIFLGLEGIKYSLNHEKHEKHLNKMIKVMERTLADIKTLTKNLRPEAVYHLGIKDALAEAVRDWINLYQINISLEMDIIDGEHFDKEKELHLFRVIQEGVANAVRHGKATSISIHLRSSDSYLFFFIEDNGNGYSEDPRKMKGLGVKHMFERCVMMGGELRWISKEGGPTRVEGFVTMGKK